MKKKTIVVLDIVGLSPHLLSTKASLLPNITALMQSGTYRKMAPSFPAVTCSVQASLLSGKPPEDHGIVGNGFFLPQGHAYLVLGAGKFSRKRPAYMGYHA